MYDIMVYEGALFLTVETLPFFSVSGTLLLNCVWCWSLCTVHFMYISRMMGSVLLYCI